MHFPHEIASPAARNDRNSYFIFALSGGFSFLCLDTKKRNKKTDFIIIAPFGISQASLELRSLNAIIQGCVCLTQKSYVG